MAEAYRAALAAAARRHAGSGLTVEPPAAGLAAIDAAIDEVAVPLPAPSREPSLIVAPVGVSPAVLSPRALDPFGWLVANLAAESSPTVRQEVLTAVRGLLVSTFAYAVPSPQALDRLARFGELLEIGAGGGYWARCLTARGAVVHAFDRTAPAAQTRKLGSLSAHHPIAMGGPAEALRAYPSCATLLLCWPPGISNRKQADAGAAPRYSRMGELALAQFRGANLVFIGSRCSSFGSPDFFATLDQRWRLLEQLALPNLGSWRDSLHIYKRA